MVDEPSQPGERLETWPPSLGHLLRLALWFGVVAGIGELLVLAGRKYIFHKLLYVGPQVVWMAPASSVLLLVVVGCVLWAFARFMPHIASRRVVTFFLAFFSAFNVLWLWFPSLARLSVVLLAAGIGVQIARLETRDPCRFGSFIARALPVMLVLVAVTGTAVNARLAVKERRQVQSLPAPRTGAPNVLLIVLDTVRAESLSAYGYSRPTSPTIARLAQTGVRFEYALATAPWTTPTHASIFTGRWPHELVDEWMTMNPPPVDTRFPTIAEVLNRQGYLTAGFVGNMEMTGYETGVNRGFVHYEDYPMDVPELIASSSLGRFFVMNQKLRTLAGNFDVFTRKTAAEVNEAFLTWHDRSDRRPFFAFLNYFDAHEPYLPPAPYDSMFPVPEFRDFSTMRHWRMHQVKRENKLSMSVAQAQSEQAAYDGAIAYVDAQIDVLLRELERRGVLSNTIVIITGDHGEQFGEHGLYEHVNSLYMPLLRVPLVISYPGQIPVGLIVSQPISLRALPSTIIALAGFSGVGDFQGRSLTRYWDAPEAGESGEDAVLSEVDTMPDIPSYWPLAKGDMKSVVSGPYHYVRNGDGREELYNFRTDPSEAQNLAASMGAQNVLLSLRSRLDELLRSQRSQ